MGAVRRGDKRGREQIDLRDEERAELRLGLVRERVKVAVIGAVGHSDPAFVEPCSEGRDTKEAAVFDLGVAR